MASDGQNPKTDEDQGVRHPKIPLFYGLPQGKDEVKARDLVARIEAHCTATNRKTQCSELYLVLRGKAVEWWNTLETIDVDKTDWKAVKAKFIADYEYKIAGSVVYRLDTLSQKQGESVVDFFSRVNSVVHDFVQDAPQKDHDIAKEMRLFFQKGFFISGLRDELKSKVLAKDVVPGLAEAKEYAQKMEFINTAKGKKLGVTSVEYLDSELDAITGEENAVDEEYQEEEVALVNRWRARQGRKPLMRRGGRGGGTGPRFSGTCFNCNQTGHKASQCRQPKKTDVRSLDEAHDGNAEQNTTMASIKNW